MDELMQLRKRVDSIDDQILKALCERAEICKAIGKVKKTQDLPIRDFARENEVFIRVKAKALKFNLDPIQVEAVYREIVNICSAVQE
jgi:chorismate mutase